MYRKNFGRRIAIALFIFVSFVSCKNNSQVNYNDLFSNRELIYIDERTNPSYDVMMKYNGMILLQDKNCKTESKLIIREAEEQGFYMYMLEDIRVVAIPTDGGSSMGIIDRYGEFERMEIDVEKTLKNLENKIE